jgi:hypothetical protein
MMVSACAPPGGGQQDVTYVQGLKPSSSAPTTLSLYSPTM